MSAENPLRPSSGANARRSILLVCVLVLSLATSVLLVPRASATGQPTLGYAELALPAAEQFQVMGANDVIRSNLSFLRTETVRVNVTSTVVDWTGNAAGGGSLDLVLQRFNGAAVRTFAFTQAAGGPPFVYAASADLAPLALEPNEYYLHVVIDDTRNVFDAMTPIRVGAPLVPNGIETFSDDTFSHPSDVFTPTSVVWVRVVGLAGQNDDRWDLTSFLNGASVVGGPNTGFDNFARAGTVYTFSIDLSAFGAFNDGWFYTLSVRLTNGAFDAGKQIQIFQPTVSITATNLAPGSARQGTTGVAMVYLSLSLDPNWGLAFGPATFPLDRVRITRTGVSTNADVAGVRIYLDANGNGLLDGADPLLASASNLAGIGFPVWLGQAGTTLAYLSSSGPVGLIVTYNIAPTATVGDTVGAQVAAPADLDLPGTFAGISGLPASSTNVQITGTTVLTVTNDPGIAPGAAVQAQADVPIDLLQLSSNGPSVTVTGISVTLAGSGTPADVARVTLRTDNGDGILQTAQDPVLAGPMGFSPSALAAFSGLSLAVDSVGRDVWIVYDISATAVVGDRVGATLPSNASVSVNTGVVYSGTFPLSSGVVRIAGPTLTVVGRSLAPFQTSQGRTNLPMLALDVSVNVGQATVSGFRIDKRGSSVLDSDVSLAKIWLDANRDGIYDTGDLLLGSQGFVGGTTVIGGLSLVVGTSSPRTLFITYDISAAATTGVTVSSRLATSAYVSVDAATTVSGANFPIASAATLITAPGTGAFLTVGSVDEARWTPRAYPGQANVSMEKLYLSVDANLAMVTGLRVDKAGTSLQDSDVAALKLYRDQDGNGNFSAGDTLLASTTFVGGLALFANLNLVVTANQPVTLFLVIDLARTATIGRTVALFLGNHVYLVGNSTTTVDPNSFPIVSSEVTIAGASLYGYVFDASGRPVANATVSLPQLGRTAVTDAAGRYTFSNLPVGTYYVVGHASGYDDANVSAVLSPATPSLRLNLTLQPTQIVGPGTFVAIAVGGGLALVALLSLLLLFLSRRRTMCPVCGKPKARDQEVCPECAAKGLRAPGASPPAAPPPKPPAQPPAPPNDEL